MSPGKLNDPKQTSPGSWGAASLLPDYVVLSIIKIEVLYNPVIWSSLNNSIYCKTVDTFLLDIKPGDTVIKFFNLKVSAVNVF